MQIYDHRFSCLWRNRRYKNQIQERSTLTVFHYMLCKQTSRNLCTRTVVPACVKTKLIESNVKTITKGIAMIILTSFHGATIWRNQIKNGSKGTSGISFKQNEYLNLIQYRFMITSSSKYNKAKRDNEKGNDSVPGCCSWCTGDSPAISEDRE